MQPRAWITILLVAAIIGLAVKDSDQSFMFLAYFTSGAFWSLDGFFLRREKLFRALYDDVRKRDSEDIDFSMDTHPYDGQVEGITAICFSKTLRLFHGAVFGSIVVMMLVFLLE